MKKILGMPIALFIVGLLAIGGATAALVGYISNMTTAVVEVDSPIVQKIGKSIGNWDTNDLVLFTDVKGGESITFYVRDTNVANVAITGDVNNIVTSPGITCADFAKVEVKTDSGTGYGPTYDLIGLGLCSQDGYSKVVFSYGPTPMTLGIGQVDTSEIVATFKTDAVGTYTFTTQVVPIV